MDQLPTINSGLKAEPPLESPSFHLFSDLPPELQLKIWEAAFDASSRRIGVRLCVVPSFDRLNSLSGPTICIRGMKFLAPGRDTDTWKESHSLSLACCDARKVYLSKYPETIILENSPDAGFTRIRCNPAHDTLCIEEMTRFSHSPGFAYVHPCHYTTPEAQKVVYSSIKAFRSFQNVAVRLRRDYPSWDYLKRALEVPSCPAHLTAQYATLVGFSFFESIRHLYFLVESEDSAAADTDFFQGLPAQGYTPAPILSFLGAYDRVQRFSEQDAFDWCENHRRWRPRPLSEIQCHYGLEWLEENSAGRPSLSW